MNINKKSLILILSIVISCIAIGFSLGGGSSNVSGPAFSNFGMCSVKRIPIYGQITTYPQSISNDDGSGGSESVATISSNEVVSKIEEIKNDTSIDAIVLDIDSPGGNVVAGEEILQALLNLDKPVVTLVRTQALSAAYLAAVGSDYIVASKNSDVGSIGVILSYLENSEKNKKEGINFVEISSGRFKSMGNENKPITKEERDLIQRDIDILSRNFISTVAENRKLSIEKVSAMSDGSSVLGVMGKELGLVDEVGGIMEVKKYLESKLGFEPIICDVNQTYGSY